MNAITTTVSPEITIDPEFRDLIPPLSQQELDQLHASLSGYGVRDKLTVWKETGILVDGHNRYAFCQGREMMKEPEFEYLSFDDREDAKQWIILNQLGRRNVTPETASMLRAKFQESMSKGRGAPIGNDNAKKQKSENHTFENDSAPDPSDTLSRVAKQTGVTRSTVAADLKLAKALDKLGIPRNDYATGKVKDANGKKRSKKSIIEEAFPEKVKDKPTAPAAPAAQVDEDDTPPLVIDGTIPTADPAVREMQSPSCWDMARDFIATLKPLPAWNERQALCDVMQACKARLVELDQLKGKEKPNVKHQ